MHAQLWPRALGFCLWLLVGLSAAFWGLRLGDAGPGSVQAPPARWPGVDSSQVIAALGGAMPQAAQGAQTPALVPAQRVELRGVIAEGRRGVALLSIDGQPAKPYAVGSRLDAQRMLKAVGPRHAELAEHASGATLERLEMPQPASAPLPAGVELIQVPRP